ncbi:MAG TPA: SDR family oxidoreductase [Steroidobacteraceae bacterium]|jgi:NAD(P)-dependent dehydrogenase (short-subunit alcohol dehydrogenase family)|nr:SDR family oxidoreductase [Steroidobacteraceae bacterium]
MAVVLLTGCSSGFGLEGALAFARNGDTVFATMRDVSRARPLTDAATREGLTVRVRKLDVTEPETFAPLVAGVVAEAGGLDVLVNNAGVLRAGAFEDLSVDTVREVMDTNFTGPALLAQAALPQMRRQRRGHIIMVSSLSGVAGLPGDVVYTASKFALEGATEALRHEVDRWGIKVALIEAAMYATQIFAARPTAALSSSIPKDSPYRPLIEQRLRELREKLPYALDPSRVGELMVEIAASDGSRLRWPADDVARRVLAKTFAQDDSARDGFLREVSGTDWWSAGEPSPRG